MVNEPELVPVPKGVVTDIVPELDKPGVAVILVALFTVYAAAGWPPNVTEVAPVKPVPVMVIGTPAQPLAGMEVTTGGGGGLNVQVQVKPEAGNTVLLCVIVAVLATPAVDALQLAPVRLLKSVKTDPLIPT